MKTLEETVVISKAEQERHKVPIVSHFKALMLIPDKPRKMIREYIYETEFKCKWGRAPEMTSEKEEGPSVQDALKDADKKKKTQNSRCASPHSSRQLGSSSSHACAHIPPVLKKTHKEEEREKMVFDLAKRISAAEQRRKTLAEADKIAKKIEKQQRSYKKKKN